MLYETSHDTMSHLWNLLKREVGMWHPQGPCPFCFYHPWTEPLEMLGHLLRDNMCKVWRRADSPQPPS